MPTDTRRGWAATALLTATLVTAMGLGLSSFRPEERSATAPAGGKPGTGVPAPTVRFARDIRPILSDRCFQCHGPDAATRHADLRLDLRDAAVVTRKNGAAIVPGDPDKSELIRRITSGDPTVAMPPADSHKAALSPEQRELFRRWIAEGAVYEPHWAFVPPVRPAPPAVKNESWARNPIDRFVLARLESKNIKPSADADGATLIRRAFLDVTGLPPTPEEVDAFLADKRPDAYERWIDKLTSEEPYLSRCAERLAAPWLDQSRYADTCGIHMDAGRQMWLWRDWVLDAYRTNMPFDQFVTEQLAGDLFPDAKVSQKIASGFNRNHVTTDEGGAIAEEYLVEYAVDRVSTTGAVFLGLTVGCARCHDHKFDPITQEDFFSLYAFFNSIEEPGLYSQNPDFNRAYEPFILVPTAPQEQRLEEIKAETARLTQELDKRDPGEEERRTAFMKGVWERGGISWAPTSITRAVSTGGATLEPLEDKAIRVSGPTPDKDDYVVTLRTDATNLRLISLEALEEPTAAEGRFGRSFNGNVVVSGLTATVAPIADPSSTTPIKLVWAWADVSQMDGDYDITNILEEDERGWALAAHQRPGGRVALLMAETPFGFAGGAEVKITVQQRTVHTKHTLARFRLGLGAINEAGMAMLPSAVGRWYVAGPFPGDKEANRVFEPVYGPEEGDTISPEQRFTDKNVMWRFDGGIIDGRVATLAEGRNIHYLGKYVYSPAAREMPVSLGSDDGFRLYLNGTEVAQRRVDRGVAPDQDKATLSLKPGRNAVVMKIVNTGGPAGFYYRGSESPELPGDLAAALLPEDRRPPRAGPAAGPRVAHGAPAALPRGADRNRRPGEGGGGDQRQGPADHGDEGAPHPACDVHPDARRLRQAGQIQAGHAACADIPGQAPREGAGGSAGPGALDGVRGKPAAGARDRQSVVGTALRERDRPDQRGFRPARRMADAPGASGLARRRVPRERVGRSGHAAADAHQQHVSAGVNRAPGAEGHRPGQPAARLLPPTPPPRGADPRPGAVRIGPAGGAPGRPVGEAVPARGAVAGGGDAAVEHPGICAGPGGRAVAAQPVHVLEARGAPAVADDVRCADPRVVRDAPG